MPDPSEGARVHAGDALSDMLAADFIEAATTGEEVIEDERSEMALEEIGGPFTASTAGEEFAYGTDESNPAGTRAEAFPTSTHSVRP